MISLEYFAVVVTLVAVYLTARQIIWCWPLGMVSVVLYAAVFFQAKLYADMGLQGLYFALAAYGWWAWLHGGKDHGELRVSLASNRMRVGLIAATTSVFDEMGLNVLAARVVTTSDGRSFDLFQVMDRHGEPLNVNDSTSLRDRLESRLSRQVVPGPVKRKLPRRLRPFVSVPEIRFTTARGGTVTSVEIECTDRPGLLSQLAAAMVECGIKIHDAMIATFGDRVEDTFLVSDPEDGLLDESLQAKLVASINRHLNA